VAQLQREAGDLDGAVWSLQKATDGDPSLLPARIRLAELLITLGRLEKATGVAEKLQQDFPDAPHGYHLMALVQTRSGEDEKAVESLRTALSHEPSPVLAVRLSEALRRARGEEEAAAFLTEWLEERPEDAVVREALAESHFRRGQWQEAEDLYESLLEDAPDSALLLNNLALVYERTGDPRALEYARRAYSRLPDVPQIGDTLGWILVKSGKRLEGLRYLRDAQTRAAGDPAVSYHIALALAELGRPDEALRELRKAVRPGADYPERGEAEALLERLEQNRGG
jgi:tetratricopeptide (TPR) repeat protein